MEDRDLSLQCPILYLLFALAKPSLWVCFVRGTLRSGAYCTLWGQPTTNLLLPHVDWYEDDNDMWLRWHNIGVYLTMGISCNLCLLLKRVAEHARWLEAARMRSSISAREHGQNVLDWLRWAFCRRNSSIPTIRSSSLRRRRQGRPKSLRLMLSLINAPFTLQTTFDNGVLRLTTHRLIWDDEEQEVWISRGVIVFGCDLSLDNVLFSQSCTARGTCMYISIGKDFSLGSKSNH